MLKHSNKLIQLIKFKKQKELSKRGVFFVHSHPSEQVFTFSEQLVSNENI